MGRAVPRRPHGRRAGGVGLRAGAPVDGDPDAESGPHAPHGGHREGGVRAAPGRPAEQDAGAALRLGRLARVRIRLCHPGEDWGWVAAGLG